MSRALFSVRCAPAAERRSPKSAPRPTFSDGSSAKEPGASGKQEVEKKQKVKNFFIRHKKPRKKIPRKTLFRAAEGRRQSAGCKTKARSGKRNAVKSFKEAARLEAKSVRQAGTPTEKYPPAVLPRESEHENSPRRFRGEKGKDLPRSSRSFCVYAPQAPHMLLRRALCMSSDLLAGGFQGHVVGFMRSASIYAFCSSSAISFCTARASSIFS